MERRDRLKSSLLHCLAFLSSITELCVTLHSISGKYLDLFLFLRYFIPCLTNIRVTSPFFTSVADAGVKLICK